MLVAAGAVLATLTWRPGYRSARFRQTRDLAARLNEHYLAACLRAGWICW